MAKVDRSGLVFLLDMDGVVSNFMHAACRLFGRDYASFIADWPKGEYAAAPRFDMETAEFWSTIEEAGVSFWSDMQEYPWAMGMISKLQEYGTVVFCTSPSWNPYAAAGKIMWLQARFGKPFRNYVITNQKHLLAAPRTILIDDMPAQVDTFEEAGGDAILFPQPWNDGPALTEDEVVLYVMDCIAGTLEG
jgi:hypothetical protein